MTVLTETPLTTGKITNDTTCFYSIKLGCSAEFDVRRELLEANQIAISFVMTDDLHREILARRHDEAALRQYLRMEFQKIPDLKRQQLTYWVNQHLNFYRPEKGAVWLTVDKGVLYYAKNIDDAQTDDTIFKTPITDGWIKRRITGWSEVPIPIAKLPGLIRNLSVQRQTIVKIAEPEKPKVFALIKNVLNQEKPLVEDYNSTYSKRDGDIQKLIQHLDPSDFETLIDLLLYRMSYSRESVLGEDEKSFDGVYKDQRNEKVSLYVQVKCKATKDELDEFSSVCTAIAATQQDIRAIFAYHTPAGRLASEGQPTWFQVWDAPVIANHVINLGLEKWVLDRVYA